MLVVAGAAACIPMAIELRKGNKACIPTAKTNWIMIAQKDKLKAECSKPTGVLLY